MNTFLQPSHGTFVLRISLGIILIAHSVYLKAVVFTLPGTAQYFASMGLPAILAYVVFAAEALGGIALIVGFQTRLVSLLLIPILLGATWAHSGNGWVFSNANGGWEYPFYLTITALVQAMLGSGDYAIDAVKRPVFA